MPLANHLHLPRLIALWKLSFLHAVHLSRHSHAQPLSTCCFAPFCSQGTSKQSGSDKRLPVQNNTSWQLQPTASSNSPFSVERNPCRRKPMLSDGYDISHLDLTLSRNRPCSSRSNKHYSVSRKRKKKSMVLSLLCLIGLRRNQIERDNCVPVTFPPRQSDTVGMRAPPLTHNPREGRTTRMHDACMRDIRVCQHVSMFFPTCWNGPIVHTGHIHTADLIFSTVVFMYLFHF